MHLLAQIGNFPLKVDTVALAPDGTSLTIAVPGSGISIWDLEASIQQSLLDIPEEAFRHPDPIFLQNMASWVPVMVRENGMVEVWETTPARLLTTFVGVADLVDGSLARENLSRCRIACSLDGTQVAVLATFYTGKVFSRVSLWHLTQEHGHLQPVLRRTLPGPPDFIAKGWYLQADPRLFCVSHQDTTVWAINLATGQTEALVPGELLWPRPQLLSISPDGRYVALADGYGKVSIWNVLEQHITLQFQAHEEVKATIATKTGIDWDLATRELDWLWTPTRVEGQVLGNDERSAACR